MSSFSASVVARYLRSRRGFTAVVTGFSVLGIMLGVAALIIVLAVMSGFRQELMSRILGITGHATLEIAGLELPVAEVLSKNISAQPGVLSAAPYLGGQAMLSANGKATGAFVRGIRPEDIPEQLRQPGKLVMAEQTQVLAPGTVLVGQGLARTLGLVPGSGIQLISPEGARTPFGFIPRIAQLRVGGIFTVGMVQFDQGMVLANLKDLQSFLGVKDRVQAIEIRVAEPTRINSYVGPVQEAALKVGADPMDVMVTTWENTNADFFRALQVERVTMFIILSLIVLVAAFNIITGQMMLVNDKMSDIAILRTMGATQRQVLTIFFCNGMLLGGLGTLAGLGTGMLAVWNMQGIVSFVQDLTGVNLFPGDVYFLSELPARISWSDVGAVLGVALLLTVLASLYPAWKASRLVPVTLLKRG